MRLYSTAYVKRDLAYMNQLLDALFCFNIPSENILLLPARPYHTEYKVPRINPQKSPTCLYDCIFVCVRVHVFVCMCLCVCGGCMCMSMCMCVRTYVYMYVCMHVCMLD